MLNLEAAKKHIQEHCGNGWLTFVDIIYHNRPEEIIITEVFQKYGRLEIRYEGENEYFEDLISSIRYLSQYICEICGKNGGYTIIDGWETTLCQLHYDASKAKNKSKREEKL